MDKYIERVPDFVEPIKSIRDTIITNIVLIGEKSAPTFREKERAKMFMDRLTAARIDEGSWDSFQNPIGIIRGKSSDKPPILIMAHLDTFVEKEGYFSYTVKQNTICGPGVADNSTGVGVLATLPIMTAMPECFRR